MEIRENAYNSHYYPSDNGDDSVLNINCAGYTRGSPKFITKINDITQNEINFYQFEYVIDGRCYIETSSKTYMAKKGDFFFIERGTSRILYTDKNHPVKKVFLTAKGAVIDGLIKGYGMNEPVLVVKSNVEKDFIEILGILGDADAYTVEVQSLIIQKLVNILSSVYTDKRKFTKNAIVPECTAEDIARYLEVNISQKFSFEETVARLKQIFE